MLKFLCDICGRIIEDICGEHCLSDDEGQVLEYTCPHCRETFKVADKKIRKIVFLDIDGVLNSEKWAVDFFKQKKHSHQPTTIKTSRLGSESSNARSIRSGD